MALSSVDVAIVVASVVGVVTCGIVATCSRRRRDATAADAYFLAGRDMPWTIIAASLFAANVGSEQFIGMAGTAAESGIAIGIYELSAPYLLILLGWVFAPLYTHCKIRTTPEYVELRFNRVCRLVFVCVLIVTHILATISSTLYAGSVIMEVVMGLTIWQSAPLIVLLTALYTITGGLEAVMLTDALQTVILLTGGLVGSVAALNLVGGIDGLFHKLNDVHLAQFPHLIRPLNDRDFPWLGTWLALFVGGMRYWCLDQEMAQRVLSAKNLNHARLGTAGAGLLKLLPLFIAILPGMVARLLFELCRADPQGTDFPEWCNPPLSDAHVSNKAYPLLVLKAFPNGVRGLMIASFLAAMMSSLASLFNSVSAMFTYDIYARCIAKSESLSPSELVRVGRCAVVGLVIVTFLWMPVIDNADRGLFIVAAEILTHLGPAITAVFACGIFLRSVNEQGALIGLVAGSCIGTLRLMLFLVFQQRCDREVHDNHQMLTISNWFFCLNFHYFSPLLFVLTVLIVIFSSRRYPPPSPAKTTGHVVTLALLFGNDASPSTQRYTELASIPHEDDKQSDESIQALEETERIDISSKETTRNFLSSILLPVFVLGLTTWVIYFFR